MVTTYKAKDFKQFMEEQRKTFLLNCIKANNRTENTKEDYKLVDSYYPTNKELKNYGYYHYNPHTNHYYWTKTR